MYDVKRLEAEWRRYKQKQFLMVGAGAAVFLIMMIIVYVFWPAPSASHEVDHPQTKAPVSSKQPPNTAVQASEKPLSVDGPSANTFSPKKTGWRMDFSDAAGVQEVSESDSGTKHVDIRVSTRKTHDTAEEIARRFQFNKNKDDALFLARYYYDKKQYKIALKWALETNKLDSDIEESWLIFGRAKAKLGMRTEAIRVLQAYTDRTGSVQAKKLLDVIRRGVAF